MSMSSDISVRRLENPTDKQIDDIVQLLLRAYSDDVLLKCMSGDDHALAGAYFRAMLADSAFQGHIYVAQSHKGPPSEGINAVCLFFEPGKAIFSTEEQRAQPNGWNDYWTKLPLDVQTWWNEFKQTLGEYTISQGLQNLAKDSYWISLMGTDPAYQTLGLGSALLRTVQAKASKEGANIGLSTQTTANCAWYERLGMKVIASVKTPAKLYAEDISLYILTGA
ncbi:hypothetical protein CPB85DRAFT_1285623 [Mucidula mucida]|nr:hypothetical protein CPB85DRAFT_1285623 [Mucidula mucida]